MKTEFALSLGPERWTLPAGSDTITIGRASNADVRLPADDQISRIHARLGRTGTTWTLYDESRNGTGLNGRRLAAPTVLTDNDRIHIGRSVLTFHETAVPDPTAAEPTPAPVPAPPPDPAPFTPDEPEPSPFASAGSESLDTPAPPAPPDIPGRTDAPGNFPLFPDEPSYPNTGEDAPWAVYPSADNPEPAGSPWEVNNPPPAQIDPQPHWNESASWPDTSRAPQPDRRLPADDGSDEVGTVRLLRVLLIAGAVLVLGLVINLIITFLADGPGGALRWFVPPAIALVVAMIIALLDAAAPIGRAPSRLDVSVVIAIIVVLLGVGVGGFALTAGVEYVGGYLTGNESGEDRLIKPVAATGAGVTVTVQNVTYTSHFTRVDVTVKNAGKQAVKLPLGGSATFTGAEGNALHADAGRSQWPASIPAGGSKRGTITFKGRLPDATTTAVLTLKSGIAVSRITLSN